MKFIEKLKYKYYSRYYKTFITEDTIKKIKNLKTIHFARQNGKQRLAILYQYIKYVENYDFKSAKIILKNYKKYFT